MEQIFRFKPEGTCSREFIIGYEDNKITSFQAIGGCRGNLQGISALLKGMTLEEAANRLEGIECHGNTSCPDQISKALRAILGE